MTLFPTMGPHLNIEDFLKNELQDEISLHGTITIDSENNSETKNNFITINFFNKKVTIDQKK